MSAISFRLASKFTSFITFVAAWKKPRGPNEALGLNVMPLAHTSHRHKLIEFKGTLVFTEVQ